MSKKIVTINRQYGSGGSIIAQKVAEKLGIKYYDRDLIAIAARESGYAESLFENADEKPTNSLLYSIAMGTYSTQSWFVNSEELFTNDKLFSIQANVIKKLSVESCVIVGRCADFVLRNDPSVTSVFTYAPFDVRKQHVRDDNVGWTDKEAENFLKKKDKSRANYYNYYSTKDWDNPLNYHIAINTACYDYSDAAELIISAVNLRKKGLL